MARPRQPADGTATTLHACRNHAPALRAILLSWLVCILPCVSGAATYDLPPAGSELIGSDTAVRADFEDTLLDLARRHGLGYDAIVRANADIDPWLPGAGTTVRLPRRHLLPEGPRTGIVINLPEMRLYHFVQTDVAGPGRVETYPIGIGKAGWCPVGLRTAISEKMTDPVWVMPESIQQERQLSPGSTATVVPAGPENPLGRFALRLGQTPYLIHGTNRKYGIGMRVSHGCIRLYPEDIEALHDSAAIGTPVRVVHQPYKVGWDRDALLLEAHPPIEEHAGDAPLTGLVAQVIRATESRSATIDWDTAFAAARQADGIPVPIGHARPTDGMTDNAARPNP